MRVTAMIVSGDISGDRIYQFGFGANGKKGAIE